MKCNAYEYLMRNLDRRLGCNYMAKFIYSRLLEAEEKAKQKLNVTLRKGHLILVTDKRSGFYHKLNNVNKGIK